MEVQQLDLADLSNVRSFANNLQSEPKIDMLILNAGVAGLPLTYTKDNFEMQVGTNHFGHFVLVQSLLDKLKKQVKTAFDFSPKAEVYHTPKTCSAWQCHTSFKHHHIQAFIHA